MLLLSCAGEVPVQKAGGSRNKWAALKARGPPA